MEPGTALDFGFVERLSLSILVVEIDIKMKVYLRKLKKPKPGSKKKEYVFKFLLEQKNPVKRSFMLTVSMAHKISSTTFSTTHLFMMTCELHLSS